MAPCFFMCETCQFLELITWCWNQSKTKKHTIKTWQVFSRCYSDDAVKTVLISQNGSLFLNQNGLIKSNEVWYFKKSEHGKNNFNLNFYQI